MMGRKPKSKGTLAPLEVSSATEIDANAAVEATEEIAAVPQDESKVAEIAAGPQDESKIECEDAQVSHDATPIETAPEPSAAKDAQTAQSDAAPQEIPVEELSNSPAKSATELPLEEETSMPPTAPSMATLAFRNDST